MDGDFLLQGDMSMEVPIYIDGVAEGTLTLERQGCYTLVQARLRDVGRVVRLWLYGDGQAYLGVPVPEQGQLVLRRRLPAARRESFPAHPVYAAERPLEQGPTLNPSPGRHVLWHGGRAYYF
jgi:hypothetical protein